jgi:hypothetical protein
MGTDAIAVLRIPAAKLRPRKLSVRRLTDGALLSTFVRFDSTWQDHAASLRHALGELLDLHRDPRGVFFISDLSEPSGRTYGAVLEETKEHGFWVPLWSAAEAAEHARRTVAEAMAMVPLMRGLAEGSAEAREQLIRREEELARTSAPHRPALELRKRSFEALQKQAEALLAQSGFKPEDVQISPEFQRVAKLVRLQTEDPVAAVRARWDLFDRAGKKKRKKKR